jgi:hypothetical protein
MQPHESYTDIGLEHCVNCLSLGKYSVNRSYHVTEELKVILLPKAMTSLLTEF